MFKLRHFLPILLIIVAFWAPITQANDNPFRAKPNNNIETIIPLPESMQNAVEWIRQQQAVFLNLVTTNFRKLKNSDSQTLSYGLILISFIYGLLHAAGPGHGKVILSAYTLTHRHSIKESLTLSFFASMMQAVTAIVISVAGFYLFNVGRKALDQQILYIEVFSYFLVGLLGLYLLIRAIKRYRAYQKAKHSCHHHHHDCDCNHVVVAEKNATLWQKIMLIVSIGIRPCSGALIILTLGFLLELYSAAIIATFLMALGTFITIFMIATLSNLMQKFFEKMAHLLSHKTQNNIQILGISAQILLASFIMLMSIILISVTL